MLKLMERELRVLVTEHLMTFVVLMGAASIYALLIGNLYRGETVQNIPVAVCDLDDSPLSRKLIRAVADADQLTYYATLDNDLEAIDLLERGEIAGALIIPSDFSKRFYSGQSIELAFFQDGSNILQVSYALPPMQLVVSAFDSQLLRRSMMSAGVSRVPTVSMSLRTFGNPTQSYLEFYTYGVMLMATQIGMILAFSMSIFDGKKNPPSLKTFAAKEILYLMLSLTAVMIATTILISLFELPLRAEPMKIFVLCAAFLFAVENIAGLAASIFRTRASLIQCMVFYTLPAFLLSGYIWPEQGMTAPIRLISIIQPVHYILTDFRALALVGTSENFFEHIALFVSIGIISMAIALFRLHRQNQAKSSVDR